MDEIQGDFWMYVALLAFVQLPQYVGQREVDHPLPSCILYCSPFLLHPCSPNIHNYSLFTLENDRNEMGYVILDLSTYVYSFFKITSYHIYLKGRQPRM